MLDYTVEQMFLKSMEAFISFVNALDNADRITFRNEIQAKYPDAKLPRNLYYNYQTQEWI